MADPVPEIKVRVAAVDSVGILMNDILRDIDRREAEHSLEL